jgi:uncharacterized protein YbjT (DUF2867 family)
VRIAVFGATGSVGCHVVAEARRRGHDVVECTRSGGVDLASGRGVAAALDGADVGVDVTNVVAVRRASAIRFFTSTARTLRSAAAEAKVDHLVVLSIVGVERMRALGYYDAKLAQERLVLSGAVPATIVRATHFHELVGVLTSRGRLGPLAVVPSMRVQTVAAAAVAVCVVDAATAEPALGVLPDVAGPGPAASLPALARSAVARRGGRLGVVALPLPPRAGRTSRDGALLPAGDATIVGPSFEAWLAGPDGAAAAAGR